MLEEKKGSIVKKWFKLTVESYRPDTSEFLKRQKDWFANPVGHTTFQSLSDLFDVLVGESDKKKIVSVLDPLIKIRALQDFLPSKAVFFVQALKGIVRNLSEVSKKSRFAVDLLDFESKIDAACLVAFDIYMKNREKVYDLKANETRNRTFRAFARAGLIADAASEEANCKAIPEA